MDPNPSVAEVWEKLQRRLDAELEQIQGHI
jgi:hypothetical protein